MQSDPQREVIVTKWALASIPAAIILLTTASVVAIFVGGL